MGGRVVLYSTSVPTLPKIRTDIATIKRILDAKKVQYEEVDLLSHPEKRQEMLAGSDQDTKIPQLHVDGQFLGTAETIQELEDFGQLDAALNGCFDLPPLSATKAALAVIKAMSGWQQLHSLAVQLQHVLTPELLEPFFQGWDEQGGGPCRSLRHQVCSMLQAAQVPWHSLAVPAEALQEICWEKLHTGYWMDVHVAWRDAYTLFTVLAVLAQLIAQTADVTGMQQGQQLQQHEPSLLAPTASHTAASTQDTAAAAAAAGDSGGAAGATAAGTQGQEQLLLSEALRKLDLAAMMGGPRFRCWVDQLIDTVDQRLQHLNKANRGPKLQLSKRKLAEVFGAASGAAPAAVDGSEVCAPAAAVDGILEDIAPQQQLVQLPAKVPRLAAAAEDGQGSSHTAEAAGTVAGVSPAAAGASTGLLAASSGHEACSAGDKQQQVPLPPGSLTPSSAVVLVKQAPSLEQFLVKYMLAPGDSAPVVFKGVMDSWPALTKWQDLSYLSQVAGRRTVPVEVGSHYLADGWGTQLMTMDSFIAALSGQTVARASTDAEAAAVAAAGQRVPTQQQQQEQPKLLYLAQHQLFEQIPALAADIIIPDYCMLGEQGGVSSTNAWFGPAGTVTPLHQDPEHNLLAQVVGRKYVRLYAPSSTPHLYPHQSGMHTNTSQVDVECVDEKRFPSFAHVPYQDVVLEPGDMLYMPPRWWHFVKSLSISFSVSFWWK